MADWWNSGASQNAPLSGSWWTSGKGAPSAPLQASVQPGQYNAKNLPFTEAGSGLGYAGIDDHNMYGRLDKLRGLKDQTEGGNAQLWKNLSRYTSIPNAQHLAPDQAQAFNHYMQTGEKLPTLKDETVKTALDWGIREGSRSQQHKHPFMQSVLGRLLGIPITAAGFAIGGPLGAGIANGLYQGVGNHDALAGLGGFASGYAGGSLGGKLLGVGGDMAGLPGGGTFSGLAGSVGDGALNGVNQFMPSWIGSHGGSSMGSILGGVKDTSGIVKALRGRKPPKNDVAVVP